MINLKSQKLLIIAPHPDDEIIGCGGLIKKIKRAGGKVFVLFLTVGDTQDFTKKGLSTQSQRQKEIESVAKFLKFDGFEVAFPGNEFHLKLDTLGQKALMDTIERQSSMSLEKVNPTIVAFPSPTSYNQDHRIAALAAHASLRPAPNKNKHFVQIVLSYEEPADGWTMEKTDSPNFFIPLSNSDLDAKIKALSLYKSQDRPHPSARSTQTLKSLASLRGAQSGNEFAESFVVYRLLI